MKMKNISRLIQERPLARLTHVDPSELKADMKKDNQSLLTPTNDHIVKRSSQYKKELPQLLKQITDNREYFLTEVFPQALSVMNGFADANEVLVQSLGPDSSVAPLQPTLENYMLEAVKSRLIFRVLHTFNLSPAEGRIFLLKILTSEGHSNDRIEGLLHEVQSLVDMQRSGQGTGSQLQQLQANEGNRPRRRVRADESVPGTRRQQRPRAQPIQLTEEETHRRLQERRAAGARKGIKKR